MLRGTYGVPNRPGAGLVSPESFGTGAMPRGYSQYETWIRIHTPMWYMRMDDRDASMRVHKGHVNSAAVGPEHGTHVNTTPATSLIKEKDGGSQSYNGTTSYSLITGWNALNANAAFAIECWILPNAIEDGDTIWLWGGHGECKLLTNGLRFGLQSTNIDDTSGAVSTTVPTHVVCAYDGSVFYMVRNGVTTVTSAPKTTTLTASANFTIGGTDFGGIIPQFNGRIDEVVRYTYQLIEFRANEHYVAGRDDQTLPTVNITSVPTDRISSVSGKDVSTFNIQANEIFVEWQLRVVPTPESNVASGVLIDRATTIFLADTDYSIDVTDDELIAAGYGEGTVTIKAFVKDVYGNWSE